MSREGREVTGKCACGCGGATRLAPQTVAHRGWVKGQPIRFITGHNSRSMERTAAHGRNIAEGQRRAWQTKRKRYPLGAKNFNDQGYVRVKTRAGAGRWELEHALVVEKQIGRRLFPGEQVHHINGVRDDNRPENLHLCRGVSEHSTAHTSFEKLLAGMLRDGVVRFNRETAEYERC